ncbi:MAG: sigma-70 family RNA polymerase sigma factor [Chloroflexi bacterium]|nr:sigma-70 family RNA polymerase sigma factor [Chloroflexota bacterium]
MDPEESALIERAKTDSEAFGLLYERYYGRIYNYVYYRTGNVDDAQDLTARIFERAMNHIGRYEDKGLPFSAWLYRIAHNLVANFHRDRSRHRLIALDDIEQWHVGEGIRVHHPNPGRQSRPARRHPPSARRSPGTTHPQICGAPAQCGDRRHYGAK